MQQIEANKLNKCLKAITDSIIDLTKKCEYKLVIKDINLMQHKIVLNLSESRINIKKTTTQTRANTSIILARLDTAGNHRNPPFDKDCIIIKDETLINLMQKYSEYSFRKETHLHLYIEGYNDKWAFPLSEFDIEDVYNINDALIEFCKYFNIDRPHIINGLIK